MDRRTDLCFEWQILNVHKENKILEKISDRLFGKLPVLFQSESSECGLICLAMVSGYHGAHLDLISLRRRFPVSHRGLSLAALVRLAKSLNFGARPVRLEPAHLEKMRLPSILHWNLDHYVVLKQVKGDRYVIHDPGLGERTVSADEMSESFTGLALELWPSPDFEKKEERPKVKLQDILGQIHGLSGVTTQVLSFALGIELLTLLSPLFLQWTIDNVIPSADYDLLLLLLTTFGVLVLLKEFMTISRSWVIMFVSSRMNIQMRSNVFSHLIHLPLDFFSKRSLGEITSRFGAVDQIQRTLTTSFLEAILDGLMSIATLATMYFYSVLLAAICSCIVITYIAWRWAWYRPLHLATERQISHSSKQQTHFLETARGVRAVKFFNRQEDRRSAWLNLLVNQTNAELSGQRLDLVYRSGNSILIGIETILIIFFGAKMVLDGNYTAGAFIAFLSYKSQFNTRITSLVDKAFDVKMLGLHARRLADIVFSTKEKIESEDAVLSEYDGEGKIEIQGLAFRYGEQDPMVFRGVSFTANAGESVAIAGPSGCGKTTLMHVVLGAYVASAGSVWLDGIEISKFGVNRLRSIVGTVMQDDDLFAGSIAENISFFEPNFDMSRIEECARIACINEEILRMPMGFQTLIGEMGSVLSGGQKQRILLARALYKRPKILFLDEATSHLDIAKEREVNASISALKMTRIIIAHRPETIASADRVIYPFS